MDPMGAGELPDRPGKRRCSRLLARAESCRHGCLRRSLGSGKGLRHLTCFSGVRLPPCLVTQGGDLAVFIGRGSCLQLLMPPFRDGSKDVPEPLRAVTGTCPLVELLDGVALPRWAHEIAIFHTLSLWLWEAGARAVFTALGFGRRARFLRVAPCLEEGKPTSTPACHDPQMYSVQQARVPAFNLCSLVTLFPFLFPSILWRRLGADKSQG